MFGIVSLFPKTLQNYCHQKHLHLNCIYLNYLLKHKTDYPQQCWQYSVSMPLNSFQKNSPHLHYTVDILSLTYTWVYLNAFCENIYCCERKKLQARHRIQCPYIEYALQKNSLNRTLHRICSTEKFFKQNYVLANCKSNPTQYYLI